MCLVGYVVSMPAIGSAPYLEPTVDTQPGGNLASWQLMSEKGTGVLHFPKRPSWSEGFRQLGIGDWRWLGLRGTKSLWSLMSPEWMISLQHREAH